MSNVEGWIIALSDDSKKNRKALLSALASLLKHQKVVVSAFQHLATLCCSADRQVSFGAASLLAMYASSNDLSRSELKPVIENLLAQMKGSSLGLRLRCIHLLGLLTFSDSPRYPQVSAALLSYFETCIARKTNKSTASTVAIQLSCVMASLEAIGARRLISADMLSHCLKSQDVTTVAIALRLLWEACSTDGDVEAVQRVFVPLLALVPTFYKKGVCAFSINDPMARVYLAKLCDALVSQEKELCISVLYLLVTDKEIPVWTIALSSLARHTPWEIWAVRVYSVVEKACVSALEEGSTSQIHSVLQCVRHVGRSWISTGKRGISPNSPLAVLVPEALLHSSSLAVREAALQAMIWVYPVPQSALVVRAIQAELAQQTMSVNSVQRLFRQLLERAQINRGFCKLGVKALLCCYQLHPTALSAQMLTSLWTVVLKSSGRASSLALVTANINAFLLEPVTPQIFQCGAHSLVYRAIAMFLAEHGASFREQQSMLLAMEMMVFTGDSLILKPLAIRAMVSLAPEDRSRGLLEQLAN